MTKIVGPGIVTSRAFERAAAKIGTRLRPPPGSGARGARHAIRRSTCKLAGRGRGQSLSMLREARIAGPPIRGRPPVVRHTDLDMRGRVETICGDPDASVSFTCSCDRLDCISNKIEHHLFQLRAIAVNGRQIIGSIKVNPHLVRRGLRSYQSQRLLQHVSYVDGADMWA